LKENWPRDSVGIDAGRDRIPDDYKMIGGLTSDDWRAAVK